MEPLLTSKGFYDTYKELTAVLDRPRLKTFMGLPVLSRTITSPPVWHHYDSKSYRIPLVPTMLKLVEACQYVDWLKIRQLRRAVNHAP